MITYKHPENYRENLKEGNQYKVRLPVNRKRLGVFEVSVQFSHSVMSNSLTPWTAARQASLSITNSQSLLKLMSIESLMPSNHLILSFPSLPAFSLSQPQGLF